MKEYWVNVYANGPPYYSLHNRSIKEAIKNNEYYGGGLKPQYRIHVKMKEVKPLKIYSDYYNGKWNW